MILLRYFSSAIIAWLLLAAPAFADIAGRYETVEDGRTFDMEMTIEANDSGDVRVQMAGTAFYYLLRADEFFIVQRESDAFSVVRLGDMFAVQREVLDRMDWNEPQLPAEALENDWAFAAMGDVTVGGRDGTGYGIVPEGANEPMYASIVVGKDEALAPLGQAMARANSAGIEGMGSLGTMLSGMNAEMAALFENRAPLRILTVELTDVSFDPIPEIRFALPAEPLTRDELRSRMAQTVEAPPTLPSRTVPSTAKD